MKNFDLDLDIDERDWVKANPVYCPVPWCTAHDLRHARCGDADGDYEGIHFARIAYVPKAVVLVERHIASLMNDGQTREKAELTYVLLLNFQDSVDSGLVPKGRRGRRQLVPLPRKGEEPQETEGAPWTTKS